MPVEIRELVIRATITDDQSTSSGNSGPGKEELIAECIEQIMQILREKEER